MSDLPEQDQLSPKQQLVLDGFVQAHTPRTTEELFLTDQASAELRDSLTGFGLNLEDPKVYYSVVAGLSVATDKMVELIEMGLKPETAKLVLKSSLGNLLQGNALS